MATGTKEMDVTFLEKVGDAFTNFSEGFVGFLTRILGSSNENTVRKLGYVRSKDKKSYTITPGSLLAQINAFEPAVQKLTDAELKESTARFRARLVAGEPLDDLLPEVFACVREAGKRQKNMRHFDVQMLGGIVLHRGNIAEMVTGEGKTLVATLPAYLNGLEGKGVHVVTVNDYLARRDCEWMLPIYQALGMTAGFIQSDMEPDVRRRAYDCDITYGTNSEFGFDYLRDNMKPARRGDERFHPWYQQCQRLPLNYAIIDEVDNILIDEARTPLIISGPAFQNVDLYSKANDIAVKLTEMQKKGGGPYYEVKEKEHTCHLTDEGVRKAEELAGVESFYTSGNMEWPHLIDNALKAHHLYKRDKNYMLDRDRDDGSLSIIIIDEFTGRAMFGRQWSDGLHQAVEAKHAKDGVRIKQETQTLATVTLQNYFRMYRKLAGMTGTAMTEANEFWKIYKLDVIAIPTNKPLARKNYSDLVYRYEQEKWNAVVDEVKQVHDSGQPILIGTSTVEKSEKLAGQLKRNGIKYELLNAKPENVARESEIVAQAGRIGAVTIATNMAGRGTDIILGGNPETLAWAQLRHVTDEDGRLKYPTRLEIPEDVWKATVDAIETKEQMKAEGRKVAELGGLHIIGTERHDSRRIDNQLRGRSGRQGDPGTARFYLSLQDDLMRIYGGERMAGLLTRLGMQDGEAIESKMVSRQIQNAQKKVEEQHFEARKNLLEYDEVMDHQRKRVYGFRQQVLDGRNCKLSILEMIDKQIAENVARLMDPEYGPSSFAEYAANRLGVEFEASDFKGSTFEEAANFAQARAIRNVPTFVQEAMDENLSSDVEESEWQWQALANQFNRRYELKLTDRELKRIGRDELPAFLIAEAEKQVQAVDLSGGAKYLAGDWGVKSVVDWANQKFLLKLAPAELADKTEAEIDAHISAKVRDVYRGKETDFPVQAAVVRFMGDKGAPGGGGPRYDRQGLYVWARMRFGLDEHALPEEEFRTQSKSRLQEILLDVSRKQFPKVPQEAIDDKLAEELEGATKSEAEDAASLATWFRETYGIEIPADKLTGLTEDQVRQVLWNAFDERYRPEMRGLERSLLLKRLDDSWKKHLLTMDHLRSGIGLVGYAQVDPKTEYKREGMKAFDEMWVGVQDKITDAVFRMEEEDEYTDVVNFVAHQPTAERFNAPPARPDEGQTTNAGGGDKKPEPIRNTSEKVGRNDPCPCGSGKKYKNCHMRQQPGPNGRR